MTSQTASAIRPKTFAHIVYRTYRYEQMRDWYMAVFEARLQCSGPVLSFMTYDGEHHRVALLNLAAVKGGAPPIAECDVPRGRAGVDHVAYGFSSLRELLEKFDDLKEKDIEPYWCIHHGVTVSLYYADPDGNQMEFQVDCFESNDEANAFMNGPNFELNPIGVEYDPGAWLARLRAGESEANFLPRTIQLPVSEVRGSAAG